MAPILTLAVLLKIFIIINKVFLLVGRIKPSLEVAGREMRAIRFVVLSLSTLNVFNSVFFNCCSLIVTIFKSPLVRSSTSVSRRNHFLQALRQIVQLQMVMTHAILLFPQFRVWSLCPNKLFWSIWLVDIDLVIPVP